MSLDPLYRVIGWLLAVFYSRSTASASPIILLTLVVMCVQFPLTAKQTRSMIQMQRVQPEIKKIQAKYKDDKAKQNEELLKYYQENKINPLAGCLPLVITIPIGIAVFRTFSHRACSTTSRRVGHARRSSTRHLRTHDDDRTAKECGAADQEPQHRTPRRCTSSACSLNLTARQRGARAASPRRMPYFVLLALVVAHRLVPGPPDPGPPAAERATRRRTRRCRR